MYRHRLTPLLQGAIPPAIAVTIVLLIGVFQGWIVLPDAMSDSRRSMALQIDYEETVLCERFGFIRGTAGHLRCKLDLHVLHHHYDDLRGHAGACGPANAYSCIILPKPSKNIGRSLTAC
jgi:hypothetical protein